MPVPRFAILIHDHPFLHWDLLVEREGVLQSWRLLESPERWLLAASPAVLNAEAIPDHRLAYLDFEGPVSRERGSVRRWDGGQVERLEESSEVIRLKFSGEWLHGELRLQRVNGMPRSFVASYFPLARGTSEGSLCDSIARAF